MINLMIVDISMLLLRRNEEFDTSKTFDSFLFKIKISTVSNIFKQTII